MTAKHGRTHVLAYEISGLDEWECLGMARGNEGQRHATVCWFSFHDYSATVYLLWPLMERFHFPELRISLPV